jgi:hypothetical protein
MADTAVAITAGAGTNIDTRTESTNNNHRQVVVIGDPATNAGVAPVDVTNGLSVNVTNAALTVASHPVTNAGTFAVQVTSAPSTAVTNAGTFVTQENGAALTSMQLLDDVVTAQGTALGTTKTSLMGGSVTTSAPTYTTGQISPLSLDTTGALRVTGGAGGTSSNFGSAIPSAGTAVGFSDGTNMQMGVVKASSTAAAATDRSLVVALSPNSTATGSGTTNATTIRTTLATDSAGIVPTAVITAATAPASGIATLGVYNTTPVAPTAGQSTALQIASDGSLYTMPYGNPANYVSGAITTAMTGTTSTSLVAAPGASLRNYITTIICSNSHATVGTDIIIQDGSGGTTLLTIPAAAVYGGAVITLPTPLRQPTTNTALFCANVTTGASTKVSAVGFKAA